MCICGVLPLASSAIFRFSSFHDVGKPLTLEQRLHFHARLAKERFQSDLTLIHARNFGRATRTPQRRYGA